MTLYRFRHSTRYEYEAPVMHCHHLAHLSVLDLPYQRVISRSLEISPEPRERYAFVDYFGNPAEHFEVTQHHEVLEVVANAEVHVEDRFEHVSQFETGISWDQAARQIRSKVYFPELEFCCDSPLVRRHSMLRDYCAKTFAPGRSLLECLCELNRRIFEEFKYQSNVTDISTPLAQVMRERRGVCQDFAHVAVGCLRSMGLPARYISGYMETLPPPGKPKLIGADASHAWFSAYIPQRGWVDFDPTNGVLPQGRHITAAVGRDFSDVSPLKGVVLGGGRHQLFVAVDVNPVGGEPAPEESEASPLVASSRTPTA